MFVRSISVTTRTVWHFKKRDSGGGPKSVLTGCGVIVTPSEQHQPKHGERMCPKCFGADSRL